MIIKVKVIPGAKLTFVKPEKDYLKVYVNAPAVDGKANKAVIHLLSKHFNTNKKNVTILSGEKSRIKSFDINQL